MKPKFENGTFVRCNLRKERGLGKIIEQWDAEKGRVYKVWFENDTTGVYYAFDLRFVGKRDL